MVDRQKLGQVLAQAEREFGVGAVRLSEFAPDPVRHGVASTGVAGLDAALGGGLVYGAVTVLHCEDDVARPSLRRWLAHLLSCNAVPTGHVSDTVGAEDWLREMRRASGTGTNVPNILIVNPTIRFELAALRGRTHGCAVLMLAHTGTLRGPAHVADVWLSAVPFQVPTLMAVEVAKSRFSRRGQVFYLEEVRENEWKEVTEAEASHYGEAP